MRVPASTIARRPSGVRASDRSRSRAREGGDVVRCTVAPEEQELGHVGEPPFKGNRLDRAGGEVDPPQVGAACGQEGGPAGQQHKRASGERRLGSRVIRKAGDHTEGTPAWLGRDDLPVRGVEHVPPPAAIGHDVGEAATRPRLPNQRPTHRQSGHIDHLDSVRGECPQPLNPGLVGELNNRVRCPFRPDGGHRMPVTADDCDGARRVAPNEETVVDRVVRDGRGVEPGVECEGHLGWLAAGQKDGEKQKQAAHEGCSVSLRPVQ
jgi:hypothetical protein